MSGGKRAGAGRGGGRKALGAEPGLCATCVHREIVRSPRSAFVRCRLADTDPRFSRFPTLPVLACAGYVRRPEKS